MFRMTVYPASLTLLICSALIAADGDPFSRWEDPKQGSQPTAQVVPEAVRNTRPTSNSSVEFFSPQAAQKPPVGNPQAAPAPILKRERLQADVKARQSTGVGNAAFVEDTAQPAIQQTSGDFFESFREEPPAVQPEENPFEEFLGKRPTTPSAPAQTTDAAPKQQPPGFAPDALDFGGDTFAQPAGVQSAADLTEPDGPVMPVGLTGAQTPSVTLQWVHHGEFNLGQECRCDLVLENTGRSTVRNVLAEAVLPSGLQVIRATPAPTTVGGTATWTFGELQAGQKRTVELVVVPSEQGETQVSAFVRFTGGSTSSFVVQQPLLAVKVDGPETVEVGQQVNYTVAVSNPGTGKARNVVIQAAIPEGLEHRQGGSLTIDIGTLNPGELRRARLSVTGVKGGQHRSRLAPWVPVECRIKPWRL
ncbi:MAG: hypothetical protein R3C59_22005 [Planctomycetaceae bacterium]